MTRLGFVDIETTGLDPVQHRIWEVALIVRDDNGDEDEHLWHLPVDLSTADPVALDIGRFWDRHPAYCGDEAIFGVYPVSAPALFAHQFMALSQGLHLVGAVVSFDAERLDRLMRTYECRGLWHYHLVDVEALAAGVLGVAPPWRSKDLTAALGVQMPNDDMRHTALGDARWARDLYDAVFALNSKED